MINYGSIHNFIPLDDRFSYINICFRPEYIGENLITPENAFSVLLLTAVDELRRENGEGKISFRGENRIKVEELLHMMLDEYRAKDRFWRSVIDGCMGILFFWMLRALNPDPILEKRQDDIWEDLSTYIDANLQKELSLPELAGKCFYNPAYFSRAFKKRYGMTLTDYLNRKRVERAMELSENKTMTDDELAGAVGFAYKSSFYRVFKRVTGKTFAQYKKDKK